MAKNPIAILLEAVGVGAETEGLFGHLTAEEVAAARAGAPPPPRRASSPFDADEVTEPNAKPELSEPDSDGNRRRHRARFRGDVEVRSRLSGGASFDRARDISDEGIFVETPDPLDVGDPVVITLRTAKGPVQLNGRVRWVTAFGRFDDPTPGMGIEFVGLDDTKRDRLATLLAPPEKDKA
jgi:uncharacterized protein (TIGR02266 family)